MKCDFKDGAAIIALGICAISILIFHERVIVLQLFGQVTGLALLQSAFALTVICACLGWYASLTFDSFGFGLAANIAIGLIGAFVFGPFLISDFRPGPFLPVGPLAGTSGAIIAGRLMQAVGRRLGLEGVGAFIAVCTIGFVTGFVYLTGIIGEVLFGDPRFHYGRPVLSAALNGGWFLLCAGAFAQLAKHTRFWMFPLQR